MSRIADRSHSDWMAHTASRPRDLTDDQWEIIGPFLPMASRRKDGRGRPWKENRAVLDGILWILRTGAAWADLPDRYPSHRTCHRRFQRWVRCGVLKDVLHVLAEALHDEGYLDLREAFIDGIFAPAKKGGACVGKTKRGKGSKIMAIVDRHGRPVAIHVDSATPHEVTLVHATLVQTLVRREPERLIGDNAYESDQLDAELAARGVELIAPHRSTASTTPRMVALCAAIGAGGRWNACLRGSRTIDASLCVTSATLRTSWGCYILPVGLS
jgi:transposase